MAAPCTRSAGSTLLKGLVPAGSSRPLWTQMTHKATPLWQRHAAAWCRPAPFSSGPAPPGTRADPQQSTEPQKDKKVEEEEEEFDGPEYIPRKKAKNPMMSIGYAWMIGLPAGIIGFLLAKREVDKNRLKQLKVRQRMRRSNEGEYEGSRYQHHTEAANLTR